VAVRSSNNRGPKLYPDATFTLRLSYGAVKGYAENGKTGCSHLRPWQVSLHDQNQFHHAFPYNLPPRWMSAQKTINPKTPFNFVFHERHHRGQQRLAHNQQKPAKPGCLIFDGNIQSLVGDYDYDESVNRSISVDVRGYARSAAQSLRRQ